MNTSEDTHLETIEHLDFEPACEGTLHPEGLHGHDPAAPAAFILITPCCGVALYKCAGWVTWPGRTPNLRCDCGVRFPTRSARFIPL